MEEMLDILILQLKKELAKSYQSREYNRSRNTPGVPKTIGQFPKNNTGSLSDSITAEIREIDGEEMGVIVMEDYYWYVDRGRKPSGTQRDPGDANRPGDSIRTTGFVSGFRRSVDDWVRQKIGTFPGLTFEQTSFLVRRSIWNKGIGGINFINNAIDNIIDDMIERGEDEYAEQFEEFIDEKLLVLSKSSRDITYNQ